MKYTFILFVCILSSNFSFSQTTVNPYVSSIADWKIEKVEIDEKYTIVTASFYERRFNSAYYPPWIMFPSNILLFNNNESTTSNVVKNIAPFQKDLNFYTEYGKTYRVFLFFDKINAGVDEISIRAFSENKKWFEWKGIKINNPLNVTKTQWNEASLKNYLTTNSKDPREGIYESLTSATSYKYKVGVVKNEFGFKVVFLSSDNEDELLKVGDVKGDLTYTANDNLFKTNWVNTDGRIKEGYFIFNELGLQQTMSNSNNKLSFIKLFPNSNVTQRGVGNVKSSGSGFLINSDGYIATNYHVVKDASIIKVKGISGNFNTSFTARLIISDINNDLAIIKIDKKSVLIDPPYIISSRKTESGSSVFCLGYPLRATMGEEVKVTNGIISSNSGFKNDITSYQISAPIQPGNSGGPLLDDKGNLVGIINAKHLEAENVSYAVKSAYLISLMNSTNEDIRVPQINRLNTILLPEKIKQIKNYTYIIEVE